MRKLKATQVRKALIRDVLMPLASRFPSSTTTEDSDMVRRYYHASREVAQRLMSDIVFADPPASTVFTAGGVIRPPVTELLKNFRA